MSTFLVFVLFGEEDVLKLTRLRGVVESKEAAEALVKKMLASREEDSDYEMSRRLYNSAPIQYTIMHVTLENDGRVQCIYVA